MSLIYTGKMDPRAMKDIIGATVIDLLENDPNVIYLDADLMSCIATTEYAKHHPNRAIQCGISEANMMGVASGLAASGFKPIAHTFGPFASRRCFDQVFLSAGYAKNDITVIGTDPGICAAFNGGTHMPFEDMALYRAIPTATVMDISDGTMLEAVIRMAGSRPGVKFLRIGRKPVPAIYGPDSKFEIGKAIPLREGGDVTIVASGIMVAEALSAAAKLAEEGIEASVIDMFTVKPLDTETLLTYAKKTGAVVTAENHNRVGGLYAAVSEALAAYLPLPVEYVAVEDSYGQVGPQDYLREVYRLTDEHIVEKVKKVLKRKEG